MLNRIVALILMLIGIVLIVAGYANPQIGVGLYITGFLFLSGGVLLWLYHEATISPLFDEVNQRAYRIAINDDNPKIGICPKCYPPSICKGSSCKKFTYSPIIITIDRNPPKIGVLCKYHGEVWFDLMKKEV